MLKFVSTFLVLAFVYFTSYSQVTPYIEDLPYACEMFEYKDQLYFTTFERIDDVTVIGKLAKVDLLANDPVVENLLEISEVFSGLFILNDELYYTLFDGYSIYKLNLENINDEPEIFIDSLFYTRDLEIVDSKLFVVASLDYLYFPNVYAFNLDSLENEPVRLFQGFEPLRILPTEDHVYISSRWDDKIYRVDLDDPDYSTELFIDSLFGPIALLKLDDELYITDNLDRGDADGRMLKVDLNDPDREVVHFTDGFVGHHELVYHNNYIYVSEVFGNKISRIELPFSTGVTTKNNLIKNIYPNPTDDYLKIIGKENLQYDIYSLSGVKVQYGVIDEDANVDVSNLQSGMYILNTSDGGVTKFQKFKP